MTRFAASDNARRAPHRGRERHATFVQVYFHDPFLAYAYAASIAFFVGLVHAFKVLGYAGQNRAISQAAVNALRTTRCRAFITAAAIVAAAVYLRLAAHASDDPAGAIMLGMIATFATR